MVYVVGEFTINYSIVQINIIKPFPDYFCNYLCMFHHGNFFFFSFYTGLWLLAFAAIILLPGLVEKGTMWLSMSSVHIGLFLYVLGLVRLVENFTIPFWVWIHTISEVSFISFSTSGVFLPPQMSLHQWLYWLSLKVPYYFKDWGTNAFLGWGVQSPHTWAIRPHLVGFLPINHHSKLCSPPHTHRYSINSLS